MKTFIVSFIDRFYPPFRKIMPLRTFRYAVSGGTNTVLGLLVYFFSLRYIFKDENADLGFIVFKPHNAALFCSTLFSFILGFLLNKYIVFTESYLKGRVQLFRYMLAFIFNLVLNYLMLRLLVEYLGWNPYVSQVLTIIVVVTLSYISQSRFSFRSHKK